jgi:hypothetical protein
MGPCQSSFSVLISSTVKVTHLGLKGVLVLPRNTKNTCAELDARITLVK